MSLHSKKCDDIKRTIRNLKKFEIKIRSNSLSSNHYNYEEMIYHPKKVYNRPLSNKELIWNKFFDLKEGSNTDAKYTLERLALMTKDEFKDVIEEFFYHVYYWFYTERGLSDKSFIDLDLLTRLELPLDSNYDDVIRQFKERVKEYHPDNGGDADKFLDIMENYKRFKTNK
ncbi:MAG: J domain-containing protein [Clostridiales bacterium]|nr:J domain-containing protein [Clostridiales bacterium]